MAEDNKKGYPSMPANSWWILRRKFRNTIPARVTPSYLASALDMTDDSASKNVMPSLRMTGLVDEEGKPTNRAVKWRDDQQYTAVCQEIREEVYPQELLDLTSDETFNRASVQRWFANHLGVGESAARKTTSFYLLLTDANIVEENSKAVKSSDINRNKVKTSPQKKSSSAPIPEAELKPKVPESSFSSSENKQTADATKHQPSVHVNIQIHISPDSSAEQVDLIFASMAKHLGALS